MLSIVFANQLVQAFYRCSIAPDQRFEMDKEQSYWNATINFVFAFGDTGPTGTELDIRIPKLSATPLCHSLHDRTVALPLREAVPHTRSADLHHRAL
jgi:hypothetical protein